jgi:hypothetical protein
MTENIQQMILQLEEKLQAATLQNDVETTAGLLADDWLNINANGAITDKARSLEVMTKFKFISITNEDVMVRVYPGTVVVTGRSMRQLEAPGGKVITSHVLFTRVYAQPKGDWQVVTSQATPISQPAK